VLFIGLVDPNYIYPAPNVEKTLDCYYTAKGQALRERHPLPNEAQLQRLEDCATSMASLGELLRRTRTLYSYNHATNVLKEAAVSGCRVLVVDQDGGLHDPEVCSCAYNIYWEEGFREGYGQRFHDSSFVRGFVGELRTRWELPGPPSVARKRRC
jgi:hypothetical protein